MADSSNEVQTNIYRHLQPIISERLLTPEQADTIVKFISTDYPVRRAIRISSITQASAYTNLYLLLEFLRKNSPISIVDEHVSDLFHTLVVGLCWHFEGSWFDKLLEFSHEIKSVRDLGFMETLEGRKKHLTISDSQRFNPKRKGQSNEALKAKKGLFDYSVALRCRISHLISHIFIFTFFVQLFKIVMMVGLKNWRYLRTRLAILIPSLGGFVQS